MKHREGVQPYRESMFTRQEIAPEHIPHESDVFVWRNEGYHLTLQPKVRIRPHKDGTYAREVVEYEALVRHLITGQTPVAAIARAERDGTINSLTREVLTTLVSAYRHGLNKPTSCNIHPHEITPEFVSHFLHIRNTLAREGIDSNMLRLEILERAPLSPNNVDQLRILSTAGVHLSLDDFGTAHATLDTIDTLQEAGIPIDVKLDQSLKNTVPAWVQTLKTRGVTGIIAEGIEHLEQLGEYVEDTLVQSYAIGGTPMRLSLVMAYVNTDAGQTHSGE